MIFFKEFRDNWTKLAILSLLTLLIVEWAAKYDTVQRQIALSITNIAAIAIFYIVYRKLKNKYQIILPGYIAWVAAFGVWLDAAGNFAHFYIKYSRYDDLTHFIGSMSIAIPLFYVFYQLSQKGYIKLGRFNIAMYSVSLTMLFVSAYEISEWIGDIWFATYRVTDRFDSPTDMFYNLLGASAVALVGWWVTRRRRISSINAHK